MAFTFHPNKIVFNDSTELLTASELGVAERKLAQVGTSVSKTFTNITPWDDTYLTTSITTTVTQSIVYTCSFSLIFESATIAPEIRFLRNGVVVYQPDYVVGWQHDANKSTGNGQFMFMEQNVPPGTYTVAVGLRNNDASSTFITNEHDFNTTAQDVFSVYYY